MCAKNLKSQLILQHGIKPLKSNEQIIDMFTPLPIAERSIVMTVMCVCLSVCLSVSISPEVHIRSLPNFLHVTCGRGSIHHWRRSDMLCISGFTDDVIFARKPGCSTSRLSERSAHLGLGYKRCALRSNISCRPKDTRAYFFGR